MTRRPAPPKRLGPLKGRVIDRRTFLSALSGGFLAVPPNSDAVHQ